MECLLWRLLLILLEVDDCILRDFLKKLASYDLGGFSYSR